MIYFDLTFFLYIFKLFYSWSTINSGAFENRSLIVLTPFCHFRFFLLIWRWNDFRSLCTTLLLLLLRWGHSLLTSEVFSFSRTPVNLRDRSQAETTSGEAWSHERHWDVRHWSKIERQSSSQVLIMLKKHFRLLLVLNAREVWPGSDAVPLMRRT